LLGTYVAATLGLVEWSLSFALMGGGSLVAMVGFVDDHQHVPPRLRLMCHFGSIALAVALVGGLPPVDFGWGPTDLGLVGTLAAALYMVWFLNLFNFMDGIDGIAGVQAVSMSLTAALLVAVKTGSLDDATVLLLLAASVFGFLVWNWPPARIFMGDVGSGFLGYSLGVVALWTVVSGQLNLWVWLILGGTFLADATVTLIVRVISGQSATAPHRSHVYQRLTRFWRGHRTVTITFAAVNIFWLAPFALIAAVWPRLGSLSAVAALLPLCWTALALGAGRSGEISDKRSKGSISA